MGFLKNLPMIAHWLVIIGAINWGLVGLLNMNIVESVLGYSIITKVIYILIGASAVYTVLGMSKKK